LYGIRKLPSLEIYKIYSILQFILLLSLSLFSEFKSAQFPIISTLSKQLLNHSFYLLPKCDSTHSLPLLRLILSLCVPGGNDGVLCVDDVILLKNIICDCHDYLKKLIISKGETPVAVSEVKEETPPTDRGSGHLDIQRLLSQLKSGHRKPPLPLHFDGPKPTASPREEFQSGCVQHMKELRGGTSLIDYCLNMSTLLELREKRREYLMGGSKTEQQER
ncbi:PREDICTED: uncharacterized protein LOC109588677, partial [Amphimedon queenslandica]|uniref:Uncharacterized protein n=2 Tax=Amphimedon queenslandica TaxID=400682 RepID=A0AAN0JU16_AMPQE